MQGGEPTSHIQTFVRGFPEIADAIVERLSLADRACVANTCGGMRAVVRSRDLNTHYMLYRRCLAQIGTIRYAGPFSRWYSYNVITVMNDATCESHYVVNLNTDEVTSIRCMGSAKVFYRWTNGGVRANTLQNGSAFMKSIILTTLSRRDDGGRMYLSPRVKTNVSCAALANLHVACTCAHAQLYELLITLCDFRIRKCVLGKLTWSDLDAFGCTSKSASRIISIYLSDQSRRYHDATTRIG